MGDDRWSRVEELFHQAADLAPEKRADLLDRACAGDEQLRREVESLLEADAPEAPFLQLAVAQAAERLPADTGHGEELTGTKLGCYSITGLIGKGGMGAVYRAVRDDDFRMEVAIKVLKRGTDTDAALERFQFERQILAWLQHPNVARLLDGGASPDGRPYFVMEYIEGLPITDYCEAHQLGTRERLELFRSVCSAVHYAHKNLVVHRDLKPGNILVTGDGVPKLLDFGVAKILSGELSWATVTMPAMRPMTPEYASPEQVQGEPITTSSDVYSLGVLLYELLTGRRPYEFKVRSPQEIASMICERAPEKPSTVKPEGGLKGDLDNIVLMAMHKEPQRRYASAEQLSEDIARHLTGRPVMAQKDTTLYVAGKFIRRHRVGVMAACLVGVSLLAGTIAATWQAHVAAIERGKAERRFNDVRKLANSMLFELHDGIRRLPGSTPVRELLLTRAVEYLDSLAREAEGNISLQRELAAAYERVGAVQGAENEPNVGRTRAARESYQKAVAIREKVAATQPADREARSELARGYTQMARMLGTTGETQRALEFIRRALAIHEEMSAAEPGNTRARVQVANTLHAFAGLLAGTGDLGGTLDARHRALGIYKEVAEANPTNTIYQRNVALGHKTLGAVQGKLKQFVEGLQSYRSALVIDEALLAATPTSTEARMDVSFDLSDIGYIHWQLKDLPEALSWYHKALAIRETLAAEDPSDARVRYSLATTLERMGSIQFAMRQPAPALRRFVRAVALREALATADPANVSHQRALAEAYKTLGDSHRSLAKTGHQEESWREARSWYQRGLERLDSLAARGALSDEDKTTLTDVSRALEECNGALNRTAGR